MPNYPCAATPGCGMEHDVDEHESRRYHILVNKHDKDHADAYLALLTKLRDQDCILTIIDPYGEYYTTEAQHVVYKNLLVYLEVTP